MKKNLLLNPQDLQATLPIADPKDRELFAYVRDFFEHKGNPAIKIDTDIRRMPTDYYQLIKDSQLFAKLLTPAGYGDADSRWDHYRLSAASELLGFYGFYQYTLQVSVLGTVPIWSSHNEKEKRETAEQLKEGNVFAFGMSEKAHGADLYATECAITPLGNGKYVANGEKYYIGNSSRASKISVMGKDSETGEFVFWVVDSRDRHCKYCGDIETPGLVTGQLGHFEMIEYPLTEDDILARGQKAFAMGFAAINVGKTQTSVSNNAKVVHMLYETVHHSNNRILYGKKVTSMPHIRRAMLEAWCRLVLSRMYAYRCADYFRSANHEDRRYLCFNPIQKAYSCGQCETAAMLLLDVMAAKAYEQDMFAEYAVHGAGMPVRLEGTPHVNLMQVVKFMPAYYNPVPTMPKIAADKAPHDDSGAMFHQEFGGASTVTFDDYRASFEGCELPNVEICLEQAAALGDLSKTCPMTKAQSKNPDFALNISKIFASVVFGQLAFEKLKLEGVEDDAIDQMFSYIVRDNSTYAQHQLLGYTGHFEPGQEDALRAIIKAPHVDLEQENRIVENYVLSLDGAYKY